MPQVVAVAVAAFQAAATVATTVGTAMGLSGLAATVAGAASIISSTQQAWSAVSSAIGSKPKVNAAQTQLQTKVGAVTPRAIIMGRTAVAGTLLTPTPLQSGRGNALATNFYALSHAGPSGVVESVQWGDDTVTFDAQGQAIGKYANNMWLFQRNGSWSQTSITFTGTPGIGADTPTQWDSTKRAQGCLVVALVVRYAASVLANNMQTPLFVVDANAVALTDPRTGTAATTQAQRRNPAVWAYSWRLGWFQNSKRVIGLGQPAAELHAAGYAYAANVADANSWTISGEASTADDRYAVEMAILQACASVPVERNGLQSVVTSALRSSVGTITSNDLRADPKWRYNTQQSSRPTAIQTRYRSETNRWQMVEGAEVTDASWLTQDAGREKRIMVEYAYAGGGSAHVGHLAALDASNAREPLVFTLQCKQQARYAGFVGDAVTVSLPEIGLSSTKMVVVSRIVNPDGTVDYELLVETDAKYAFAAGKTSAAPSFTLQPGFDIFSVPQPDLADWASVAAQITSGATSLPIVRVTGSAADYSFASGVVFKIRLNSGGSPWLVSEDAPPAATQHEFRGLTNATSYIVGVAYRGVTGVEGPVRELAAVTTGSLVAGEAANLGPQQPNLVPGSAPIYREGVPGAGWLGGDIFGPWRVVSVIDGPLTGAAWQCDVETPVGYQGVMSPSFTVTAGETLWASVIMRRVGTWVRGDGGAAIAWFDAADNQIARTQLGRTLDVDNEALSGGWVKLITASSVVPTGAVSARFENFVEDADGSAGASFQAQAAMINRGDRLYAWNDVATPSALYGADFQGGITNGGSLVGITAVDNNLVPRLVDIPRVIFNGPWTGPVYLPNTAFVLPRVTVGQNDLAGGVVTVSSGGGVTVTLNVEASGFTISNPIRNDIIQFSVAFPGRTPISGSIDVRIERDPEPRLGGTGAASAIDPTVEPAISSAFGVVNAGPVIVRSSAAGRIIASLFGAFGTVSPSPNGLFARVQYRPVSGGSWVSSGETASLTNARGGYSEYDPDAMFETWSGLGEPVLGFGATVYVPPIDGTIQMIETITGLSASTDYEVQLQLRNTSGGEITLPASQFTVEGK